MNNAVIVNATALDRSGALSILLQFIENIPVDNRKWLIFTPPNISIKTDNKNVRIVPVENVKSMIKRIWWDTFGVIRWLKKNKINPLAAVSLQNTGFRVGEKVPSYIYYHQSIPFYPYHWNPFKKQERTFWFYKKIYPFFVNLFLKKDTQVFVQLEFIKDGFAKHFKHSKELIGVYYPIVSTPKDKAQSESTATEFPRLLYPAMPHFYKNHRVISKALEMTDTKVDVLFTIVAENYPTVDERIKLIGMQPYNKICELYYTCDALLFPSYIETFGLPLLEAAMTGMPIIASDLPYAREVLKGYEGAIFVEYNNPQAWSTAIDKIEKGKRYQPIDVSNRPGWKELFEKIKI